MQLIGFLINHVYRSLFIRGEGGYRSAYSLLKIFFIATTLYAYICSHSVLTIYLVALITLMALLDQGLYWILSSTILSLIPGLWYGLSALIMSLLNLSRPVSPETAVWIGFRTFTLSYMIIFYATLISPVKLYNTLLRIRGEYASAPLLLWRTIPYGLTNMNTSLAIALLKNEKIWRRIAPATASLIEMGDLIKKNSFYKLVIKPKHMLKTKRSLRHETILIATSLTTLTLAIIM